VHKRHCDQKISASPRQGHRVVLAKSPSDRSRFRIQD
jgi:hypothetical protein